MRDPFHENESEESLAAGNALYAKASDVETHLDLIALIGDLRGYYAEFGHEWVNENIDDYLEAMSGVLTHLAQTSEPPAWRAVAQMLVMAAHYE